MKKLRLITVLCVVLISVPLLLSGCSNKAPSTPAPSGSADAAPVKRLMDRPLMLGFQGASCEAYFYAAEMLNLYEKYGLDVEMVRATNARDNIASGKLDVTESVIQEWVIPIEQGLDVKFTLGMHQGCSACVVLADSPFYTIHDLIGKTIGVGPVLGGGSQNYMYRYIMSEGLDPANDFQWTAYEGPASIFALESGQVEAIIAPDPFIIMKIESGEYRYISNLSTDEYTIDELCCLLVCSSKFVNDYPEAAKEFTKAIYEATEYVQDHREEVTRYAMSKDYLMGTLEENLACVKYYTYKPSVAVGRQTLENSFRDYKKAGLIDESVDIQAVIDRVYVTFDGIDK